MEVAIFTTIISATLLGLVLWLNRELYREGIHGADVEFLYRSVVSGSTPNEAISRLREINNAAGISPALTERAARVLDPL